MPYNAPRQLKVCLNMIGILHSPRCRTLLIDSTHGVRILQLFIMDCLRKSGQQETQQQDPEERRRELLELQTRFNAELAAGMTDQQIAAVQYRERLENDLIKSGLTDQQIAAVLKKEKLEGEKGPRPTYTRMTRRHLSFETLNTFGIDYAVDQVSGIRRA